MEYAAAHIGHMALYAMMVIMVITGYQRMTRRGTEPSEVTSDAEVVKLKGRITQLELELEAARAEIERLEEEKESRVTP